MIAFMVFDLAFAEVMFFGLSYLLVLVFNLVRFLVSREQFMLLSQMQSLLLSFVCCECFSDHSI